MSLSPDLLLYNIAHDRYYHIPPPSAIGAAPALPRPGRAEPPGHRRQRAALGLPAASIEYCHHHNHSLIPG
jgi:hypothetical protein